MNNFIEIYDNVLPVEVCNLLMSTHDFKLYDNSNVISRATTMDRDPEKLSSTDMYLSESSYELDELKIELDINIRPKLKEYDRKYNISYVPDTDSTINEDFYIKRHTPWNIKKYTAPDDGYNAYHCDWSTHDIMIRRVVASIVYLNDVKKGGETEFYHQNVKVKPKQGRLVLFPAFYTHLHKGHKPISNDKYIAMCWNTTL